MKKPLHLMIATLISSMAVGQVVTYAEDFDDYADGQMLVATVGLPWATWTGAANEDVTISSEQAASGPNSVRFSSTASGGGPGDVMLRLGNRTEGTYVVTWNMYIAEGFGGYFNVQHNEVPGAGSWAADVTFRADGSIEYSDNVTAMVSAYQHNEWFEVALVFDLDNMVGGMAIDGSPTATWQTNVQSDATAGMNQLGGINFFAYAGTDQTLYYIDDVTYVNIFSTGIDEVSSGGISLYPNPTNGPVTVELSGASADAMVSLFDITGRMVINEQVFGEYGSVARAQLDLSGLQTGVFLLRVIDGTTEYVHRLVKN